MPDFVVKVSGIGELAVSGPLGLVALALCLTTLLATVGLASRLLPGLWPLLLRLWLGRPR